MCYPKSQLSSYPSLGCLARPPLKLLMSTILCTVFSTLLISHYHSFLLNTTSSSDLSLKPLPQSHWSSLQISILTHSPVHTVTFLLRTCLISSLDCILNSLYYPNRSFVLTTLYHFTALTASPFSHSCFFSHSWPQHYWLCNDSRTFLSRRNTAAFSPIRLPLWPNLTSVTSGCLGGAAVH